jgi:hypothetical protein
LNIRRRSRVISADGNYDKDAHGASRESKFRITGRLKSPAAERHKSNAQKTWSSHGTCAAAGAMAASATNPPL